MSILSLRDVTVRKTASRYIYLGPYRFLVSYDTVIAIQGPDICIRLENTWGPTTGRHMNEAGVRDFPVVSKKEFEENIISAIANVTLDILKAKFKAEE